MAQVPPGPLRATACVLLLAGFAVKVGLVPFQVWLPRGYSAAPGPAQAIMAGVAVNVGFYGLWRTLALLGPPPSVVTAILLVLASLTAVLGIAHAAVQTSLKRVIAYSSVENAGLILAGFGVALVGAANGSRELMAAGLLAGTLQVVAHTAAKSLLFVSSAGIEAGGSADDLDDLRGSARLVPWSGTGLAIGSLTLAGLPPTAGFVSEWFLLEALMQQFRVPGLGDRLVLAVTGAAVALTAGFAGVTFVRLVGLVVLGKPRSHRGASSKDFGPAGRAGVLLLAFACLAVAALTPLEIRVIAAGVSPVLPAAAVTAALKSPWVLQPAFAGFSILSPSWLWVVMPSLFVVVAVVAWLASGRAAASGAPSPALAVGHGRRVRPGQLYSIRIRQPHPARARRGPAYQGRRHAARGEPARHRSRRRAGCRAVSPSPTLSSPPMSSRWSRSTFTCRFGGHSGSWCGQRSDCSRAVSTPTSLIC